MGKGSRRWSSVKKSAGLYSRTSKHAGRRTLPLVLCPSWTRAFLWMNLLVCVRVREREWRSSGKGEGKEERSDRKLLACILNVNCGARVVACTSELVATDANLRLHTIAGGQYLSTSVLYTSIPLSSSPSLLRHSKDQINVALFPLIPSLEQPLLSLVSRRPISADDTLIGHGHLVFTCGRWSG
jgi:hypothetical protein